MGFYIYYDGKRCSGTQSILYVLPSAAWQAALWIARVKPHQVKTYFNIAYNVVVSPAELSSKVQGFDCLCHFSPAINSQYEAIFFHYVGPFPRLAMWREHQSGHKLFSFFFCWGKNCVVVTSQCPCEELTQEMGCIYVMRNLREGKLLECVALSSRIARAMPKSGS